MPHETNAIANYFLELAKKEGEGISPMKLQKLLYYAYGWWMGYRDERLFDEPIQAWNYGPVVRSVYHEFKRFGNDEIKGQAQTFFVPEKLSEEEKQGDLGDFLRIIWNTYKKYSPAKLSNMTHLPGTPWARVAEQCGGTIPPNTAIPDEFIRDHFLTRIESPDEDFD